MKEMKEKKICAALRCAGSFMVPKDLRIQKRKRICEKLRKRNQVVMSSTMRVDDTENPLGNFEI